jgi:glycosyltransferase involved in cell wall biosynthesis
MNILQLTNKPPYPARDGGAIAMLNLTLGFARLGHRVTVLSMNTLKHHTNASDIPEEMARMADFRFVQVDAGINPLAALFNLVFSGMPYNAVRFLSKEYERQLVSVLKENRFDIIQLEGLYLCPYIPLIRKHSDALVVYRAHNVEHEIWARTALMSHGAKKWYLRSLSKRIERFEKDCLNTYDMLVPITARDESILERMGNQKPSFVSSTGIDMDNMKPVWNSHAPSLFHIGSLDWSPNQEGLLWFLFNCWVPLRKAFPDLEMHIAGRNAPEWLIRKFKRPGVVFHGEIDDAHAFMREHSVMVVPLLSGSGMRIKIIEGMAMGKAIVSTPVGAEGLGVTHEEQVMVADRPDEFVQSVQTLLSDPSRIRKMGEQAYAFIGEHFDNRVLAGKLAGFYQNCRS